MLLFIVEIVSIGGIPMNTKTTVIEKAELDVQFAYCDKIATIWQSEGRTPTAYVETYGCQQNEADSEKLRGYLAMSGYAIVQEAEGADVVIMNTCAIREHAPIQRPARTYP